MSKTIFLLMCVTAFTVFAVVGLHAQTSRKSVPAAEVNGTFRMNFKGVYKGNSNEIKILALGGGRLHIAMDLTYPYTMQNGELMANLGTLDDNATITGDTAVYESSESGKCRITIKFVKQGMIKVTQDGEDFACGFGHNVSSNGTYLKISSKRPKFDENH